MYRNTARKMTKKPLYPDLGHVVIGIQKLDITAGSVVIVQVAEDTVPSDLEDMAVSIRTCLTDAGANDVTVLITNQKFEVQTLDEAQMAAMGWCRIPPNWNGNSKPQEAN